MKINCNNYIYNETSCSKPNFRGKGIDLVRNWRQTATFAEYYKDIADDLAQGAISYLKKHKEFDNSVKNLTDTGGLTMFFDIPDSKILKVSLENPLEFRKHNPNFDIPFLTPVEKSGKTYVVVQPKADTKNITQEHCVDVKKRIYKNSCEISTDSNKFEQYGLYNGKAYLIDTRCAMPLPNTYTLLIDKICKKLDKCYTFLTKEQYKKEKEEAYKIKGYFSYHCDETPRRNLGFAEGIKKIYKTLKNNIKYRKNHYCIPYEDYKSQGLQNRKIYEM